MRRVSFPFLALFIALPAVVAAQDGADRARIENARSAAPPALAANATVADFEQNVLHEGTNGWVCLPTMPDVPNNSPMCLDETWRTWMDAYMNRREPKIDRIGVAYMLQQDLPVSNIDPFATGPTPDNQWLEDAGPHIMMVFPDPKMLDGFPTDPDNGGPWVMWKGTPYAHLMIPTIGRRP